METEHLSFVYAFGMFVPVVAVFAFGLVVALWRERQARQLRIAKPELMVPSYPPMRGESVVDGKGRAGYRIVLQPNLPPRQPIEEREIACYALEESIRAAEAK